MTHPATSRPEAWADDEALIDRCRSGDRGALEQLARACLPRVRRTVLLATGGNQESDDIIQNAMVRIIAGVSGFRGQARLTTWIDQVTLNAVRQHFRRRPLNLLFTPESSETRVVEADFQGPDRRAEGQRIIEHLAAHLGRIAPKKRIAVMLSTAYGYTAPEIGEIVGCSAETAKKRVQHGRRELLERVRRDQFLTVLQGETKP